MRRHRRDRPRRHVDRRPPAGARPLDRRDRQHRVRALPLVPRRAGRHRVLPRPRQRDPHLAARAVRRGHRRAAGFDLPRPDDGCRDRQRRARRRPRPGKRAGLRRRRRQLPRVRLLPAGSEHADLGRSVAGGQRQPARRAARPTRRSGRRAALLARSTAIRRHRCSRPTSATPWSCASPSAAPTKSTRFTSTATGSGTSRGAPHSRADQHGAPRDQRAKGHVDPRGRWAAAAARATTCTRTVGR